MMPGVPPVRQHNRCPVPVRGGQSPIHPLCADVMRCGRTRENREAPSPTRHSRVRRVTIAAARAVGDACGSRLNRHCHPLSRRAGPVGHPPAPCSLTLHADAGTRGRHPRDRGCPSAPPAEEQTCCPTWMTRLGSPVFRSSGAARSRFVRGKTAPWRFCIPLRRVSSTGPRR